MGLSVNAPADPDKPAKPTLGRRRRRNLCEDPDPAADSLAATVQAATPAQPASKEACTVPGMLSMWQ